MIKKLLYGFAIIAGLASCNDDYTDWANPQSNAANEAAEKFAFTVQQSVSSIDFATETAENIQLFTTNLQDGQTNEYTVTFSAEDKTETAILKASAEGKVASSDLQTAVATIYGKAPIERTLAVEVAANVTITTEDGAVVAEKKGSSFTLKAKLNAPHIASKYYMVGDMFKIDENDNGWTAVSMKEFNHSDKDVYEDPVFTLMFTTTADNQYWKIIPQDNIDNDDFWAEGVVGVAVDGDDSMSGKLINTTDAKAAKIAKAGMYSITLNMMDYTYTIKEIIPEYYIVGAMQGWKDKPENKTCMLYPQSKMVHSYTTKFVGDANLKIWLGSDFGSWDACYGAAIDGSNTTSGTFVSINAGAIVCPEKDAFYTFMADFSTMSYTWVKLENQAPKAYTTISLIGDFNGWDKKDTDIDLIEVTPHNWYGSAVTLTEGQLKFHADDDWTDSWGGRGESGDVNIADENSGKAVYNGANFFAPAGTYNVFFNDITGEYVFQIVA
nr:DUF5115 domain-containing protein [uncultured Bacteroides sp.]